MKKLLLIGAGLLSLYSLGLTTAQAGSDDVRDNSDYHRPRTVNRDYYPPRRVVVRDCYRPGYYAYGYPPGYYRPRPHVAFFLPLPPIPLPFVRF